MIYYRTVAKLLKDVPVLCSVFYKSLFTLVYNEMVIYEIGWLVVYLQKPSFSCWFTFPLKYIQVSIW